MNIASCFWTLDILMMKQVSFEKSITIKMAVSLNFLGFVKWIRLIWICVTNTWICDNWNQIYMNMIIAAILALRFLIKLRFPANTPISTLKILLH